MENKNSDIVKDLKNLIGNYLTDDDSKELFDELKADDCLSDFEISELDESQIEFEILNGVDLRLLVDAMITLGEKQLQDEKHYDFLLDLSQLMFYAGETAFSLEIAEYLLSMLEDKNNFQSTEAETNLMISKIFWAQAQWKDCNHYVEEARRIFLSISSEPGIAKCENMLGTLYGEKGEFDIAQKHLENALEYLKEDDDTLSRAMILTNLGIINTINGDFQKAIWNYKTSIEKLDKLSDARRLSRVYHNVGMLYTRMEKYDDALDEFNKCISLSIENNYLSNCAIAYIGKAFIYTKLKNPQLADAYTDKSMEIAYKINDTLSMADIYKIKAMIQSDMENFQLSEELFENSIRLNKDMENKLNEAESSAELGKLLDETERSEDAKQFLDSANHYFSKLNGENITAGLVEEHNKE